ncbi:hypothetical protein ACLK17_16490 [Escherichia coli]
MEIASHPEVIFCTFGDAMRVSGKQGSLLQAKARGAECASLLADRCVETGAGESNPQSGVLRLRF